MQAANESIYCTDTKCSILPCLQASLPLMPYECPEQLHLALVRCDFSIQCCLQHAMCCRFFWLPLCPNREGQGIMTKKEDDVWGGTPLVTRTSTCYYKNEDFVTF